MVTPSFVLAAVTVGSAVLAPFLEWKIVVAQVMSMSLALGILANRAIVERVLRIDFGTESPPVARDPSCRRAAWSFVSVMLVMFVLAVLLHVARSRP